MGSYVTIRHTSHVIFNAKQVSDKETIFYFIVFQCVLFYMVKTLC